MRDWLRRAGLVLAAGLELWGWASLGGSGRQEALGYGLLHAVAALLVAMSGVRLLRPGRKARPWREGLFLLAVACVPGVGVVAVALCLLCPPRPPRAAGAELRRVAVPPPPRPCAESAAGEPGRGAEEVEQRMRRVVATRRWEHAQAVPLLRAALRDPADEVRLLAQAFLESRERALYARLEERAQALERVRAEASGPLRLELAEGTWELVRLGFVQGALAAQALRQALEHAEEAAALLPSRAAPELLRAGLLLALGEVEAASQALEAARARGAAEQVLAPYRAQVAFHQRRFAEVSAALARRGACAGLRPPLRPLEHFWS